MQYHDGLSPLQSLSQLYVSHTPELHREVCAISSQERIQQELARKGIRRKLDMDPIDPQPVKFSRLEQIVNCGPSIWTLKDSQDVPKPGTSSTTGDEKELTPAPQQSERLQLADLLLPPEPELQQPIEELTLSGPAHSPIVVNGAASTGALIKEIDVGEDRSGSKMASVGIQVDVIPPTMISVETQVDMPLVSYERCKDTHKKEDFKYFTGLSFGEFEAIYELIGGDKVCSRLKYHVNDQTPVKALRSKLSLRSRLFLVFLRMRKGLSLKDISALMGISTGTASTIFFTWVRLAAIKMKQLQEFMATSAEQQKKNKPVKFLPFKNLRAIIDCTEFEVEKPTDMRQQGNMYSDYKHFTSAKVCIAVSQWCGFFWMSDAYEGRISDKEIVMHSQFLDLLNEGEMLMADRGFKLEEECIKRKITLQKPPEMKKGKKYLTPREEVKTKSIASCRVLVEHIMSRIKNWKLLRNRIELLLLPLLSDMVYIAGFCSNFTKYSLDDE